MRVLYPHQETCIQKAINYFSKGGSKFRISGAVGTGKSITSLYLIERGLASLTSVSHRRVIVLCHTNELVRQWNAVIDQEGSMLADFEVTTYQSMTRKLKSYRAKPLAIIVDESHQGGQCTTGVANSSYKRIIDALNPEYLISLSATDFGVDEDLFGPRVGPGTFHYSTLQALKDGFINDSYVITLHTCLEQTLDNGETIVGDDVEDVVKEWRNSNVNFGDKESQDIIRKANIRAAIYTYLSDEYDHQAVFYVPDIQSANWTVNEMRKIANGSDALVQASHSKANDSSTVIAAFKRKEFKVLVNVRQIQEGFDYPDLEVIFDCCPSTSNEGRIYIQRQGRALRKTNTKDISRYYMVISPRATRKVDLGDAAERLGYDEQTKAAVEDRIGVTGEIIRAFQQEGNADGVPDSAVDVPLPETITSTDLSLMDYMGGLMPARARVIKAGGHIITSAQGSKKIEKVCLSDVLNSRYWTNEELLKESSKYISSGELRRSDPNMYFALCRRGLLKQAADQNGWRLYRLKGSLTRSECLRIASKFTSSKEWANKDSSSYTAAGRKKWRTGIISELGWSNKNKNKPIICRTTGKIYESINAAARDLTIATNSICMHLKGKYKHVGGHTFSYVDDTTND
jgi:superfamily II DNA or RNA helicase